ncbi:hypothetical protein FJT64_017662 [Amphibalanus amphitrite]|uniref:Uncharacterized protein n=1 Tax=Amphibalanus amphitrite TaxID=1232801 RepID=A0A6A4XAY6_AMPAM|nr:hypothetical protein FJT64_017662 [Amphibalanus amphitrite]
MVWLVSSNLLTGASSDLSNTPHGREAEAAADLQRLAVSGQNISWWLPSAEPQGGPDRDSAEDGDSAEDLSTSDSLTGRLLFWEPRRGRPTAAYHGHGAESAGTWQSGRFGKKLAGRPGGGLRTSLSGLDGTLVGSSAPAGKLAGAAEKLGAPANSPEEELAGVARELGAAGQPGGAAGQLGGPDRQLGHFSATVTSGITFEQLGGVAGKLRGLATAGESSGQIGNSESGTGQLGGLPVGPAVQLEGLTGHLGGPGNQIVPTGLTLEGGFGGETDLGGFDELNGLGDVDATVDVELSTTKELGKPLTKEEHITTSSVDSLSKKEKSVKLDEPIAVAFLPRATLRHLLPYGVVGRLLRVIYVPGLAGLTGGHSVQLGYLVHGARRQPVPLVPLQFPERRW